MGYDDGYCGWRLRTDKFKPATSSPPLTPLPLGDSICNKNLRLWVGFPFLLQKEVQITKTLYGNGHNFCFYHKMKHKAADKTLE